MIDLKIKGAGIMSKPSPPARSTIEDVAAFAGVSIATVSRVINKTGPVAEKTAKRVRIAITELAYIPHAAARGLASRKTKTLGLLLPAIGDAFFAALLRGIAATVNEQGYALLIYSFLGQQNNTPEDFYQPLSEHNADGFIIFTESLNQAEITRLHARQFPMVVLHKTPPTGVDIPHITFENKDGVRHLVKHLIEVHNCQRIVFLAGPKGNEDSYWREMGYREALAAHNIPFDPKLIALGNFNDIVAEKSVEKLLAAGVEFEAIAAGDDISAMGAITALRRFGKRIPQDVAVVGFDDLFLSQYLTPPLTTIRAPIEQVGREAVSQLLELINNGQAESLVLLPTEVIIRHSCGC